MSLTPPRRYWLTGASNGIGAALAEEILKTGAHLAVSSRSVVPLHAMSKRYPGQVLVVGGDLTNSQTVRETSERIAEDWGSLDTVILNAGTCEYVDARQYDSSLVEHVLRTNLLASSYCIEAALPLLRAGTAPHLVGIASPATFLPLPRAEAQGNGKAGLRQLFESWRIDLAPEGIELTVINPGFGQAPLTEQDNALMPLGWPVDKTAQHLFAKLNDRPLEIAFPGMVMAAFWPMSRLPEQVTPPVKDQS
jgi:NAD(P)-dependent dehydrogenase (short-subunit alcohol dehydrogenase family)